MLELFQLCWGYFGVECFGGNFAAYLKFSTNYPCCMALKMFKKISVQSIFNFVHNYEMNPHFSDDELGKRFLPCIWVNMVHSQPNMLLHTKCEPSIIQMPI
jgi:hypothetical protein